MLTDISCSLCFNLKAATRWKWNMSSATQICMQLSCPCFRGSPWKNRMLGHKAQGVTYFSELNLGNEKCKDFLFLTIAWEEESINCESPSLPLCVSAMKVRIHTLSTTTWGDNIMCFMCWYKRTTMQTIVMPTCIMWITLR
mgnify:CR=1 FL=1